MQNLLDFLRKYSYIFLFLILEVVGFTLLFRYNSYQGSVWFSSANTAVATIDRIYADAIAYIYLGENNDALTQQLTQLQLENERLREEVKKANINVSYTDSATAVALHAYKRQSALITSNGIGRDHFLVIDRGSQDGIRPEMGVVSGAGIVGVTYLCGEHYSLVIPVINRKSSISCRVRGQEYFGFLQWEGQSNMEAYLDDIPRYAKIKVGEKIETSGYSAVFPPGIFVGTIRKIQNAPDGQSFRLHITLGENFGKLRNVSVLTTPYKTEIDSLKSAARQLELQQTE